MKALCLILCSNYCTCILLMVNILHTLILEQCYESCGMIMILCTVMWQIWMCPVVTSTFITCVSLVMAVQISIQYSICIIIINPTPTFLVLIKQKLKIIHVMYSVQSLHTVYIQLPEIIKWTHNFPFCILLFLLTSYLTPLLLHYSIHFIY